MTAGSAQQESARRFLLWARRDTIPDTTAKSVRWSNPKSPRTGATEARKRLSITQRGLMKDGNAPGDASVAEFVASLDQQTAQDCRVLIDMMQRISGHPPQLWNVGTLGFDTYHFKYDSGREGDNHCLGFYPRKGKTTIYLMDGTARHAELLAGLGKHSTSRVCVYIKGLSDIDLTVLEQVVRASYEYIKSQDGSMKRTT
jgi:hypothetical protein